RGKPLASCIGACKAAEISGAVHFACNEERHRMRRRLSLRQNGGRAQHSDGNGRENDPLIHDVRASSREESGESPKKLIGSLTIARSSPPAYPSHPHNSRVGG